MENYTKSPLYKIEWSSNGVRETSFVSAVSVSDAIDHMDMMLDLSREISSNVIIHSVSEYEEVVEKPLNQDSYDGDILAFEQSLFGE